MHSLPSPAHLPSAALDSLCASCPQVVTRSGSMARLEDLRKVAAAQAATVIVLHPDDTDEVRSWGSLESCCASWR